MMSRICKELEEQGTRLGTRLYLNFMRVGVRGWNVCLRKEQ